MRIALFVTCLTDTLFPATGQAVVTLLERLGHQVEFPEGQTCCGQMHFNSGYRRESLPMARGFAAAFAGFDAIVSPSASCTAMVREYQGQLAAEAGDAALARTVASLAPRVYDLSTLLVDVLGVTDVGAYSRTGSPITPPAIRCGCSGWATRRCVCCARCAGWS